MRILHLANTPLSNSPANLASCQNYVGHSSRVLLHRKSGRNKVFVGGETWEGMGEDELIDIFEAADIIHFHNFTWDQEIFKQWPSLLGVAKTKKSVVQFHSSRKAHESFESTIKDEAFIGRRLVIAQYHPREYPECEWVVPNPLPLHESVFAKSRDTKWLDVPPLTVSYAPSNTTLSGWDYKGYDQITKTFREMADLPMSTDVMVGIPYEECLNRKAWSHIGIEEFFTGSYHLSFLEYMAFGCLTFGNIDTKTKEALASIVGVDAVNTIPMVKVNQPHEFREVLAEYVRNPSHVKEMAQLSRAWIFKNWCPKNTTKFYTDIYEKL